MPFPFPFPIPDSTTATKIVMDYIQVSSIHFPKVCVTILQGVADFREPKISGRFPELRCKPAQKVQHAIHTENVQCNPGLEAPQASAGGYHTQ